MGKYKNAFLKLRYHNENDSNNQIHLDKGSREYQEMIRDHRGIPEIEQEYMKKDRYRNHRDLVCTDPFYPNVYKKRSEKEEYFLKKLKDYREDNHEKIHAIVKVENVKNTNQKLNNLDDIHKQLKERNEIKKELQIQDTDYVYDSDVKKLNNELEKIKENEKEEEQEAFYPNNKYY